MVKFSSGAYRHCRPCTAATVRGGVADDESSILVCPNFEEQGMSDHMHHNSDNGMLHEEDGRADVVGDSSWTSSSRNDLLCMARRKRHKKKATRSTSASTLLRSTIALKQLPCSSDECNTIDAIEQLLNAHFLREERILEEERACVSRDDEQLLGVESARADCQLLEDAEVASREHQIAGEEDDGDGHVSKAGGKRHVKVREAVGKCEEWVAQVEPGIMIIFVALQDGSNHLRRIRFSREFFSKWQAQQWWAENSEMVRELYSVSKRAGPFKSCTSARSSSTSLSSSSSFGHHALRNTPEMHSRVGSCQHTPPQTPMVMPTLENRTYSPTQPSTSCISHRSLFGSLSSELVDNPLFVNRPELELSYHDNLTGSLMSQRDLGTDEHSQSLQLARGDVMDADDPNALTGGLVRDVKRVRFIRHVPHISN